MKILTILVVALTALPLAAVAEIDGRTVRVTGDSAAVPSPVYLAIDGEAPAGRVTLSDASGNSLPATVLGNYLVFLAQEPGDYNVSVSRRNPRAEVRIEENGKTGALEVRFGRDLFTAFYHSPEDGKPALWPIRGEGGVSLTRDWPFGEPDVTRDHPHQKSFWTGYGNINGADYWEYGRRTGKQVLQNIDYVSGEALGYIVADFTWLDVEGAPLLDERREMIFYATPDGARIFDYNVHFKAAYGPLQFIDTKEGGLVGIRMADKLRERGGTGTITNAAGGVGAGETWGKPAAWCDYSGPIEGVGTRGIAVFDHPSNFRHPSHWHVRDYGLMGANPFGYESFYNGEKNGDHAVEAGADFPFRYRLYVHSGDVNDARVADVYAAYAQPMQAAWVE